MSALPPNQINLPSQAVWLLSGAVMLLAGAMFASIAFAAGIRAVDTLACLFVMGAAGTQLALIVLYLINRKTQ